MPELHAHLARPLRGAAPWRRAGLPPGCGRGQERRRAPAASNLCNLLADRAYATGSLDDVHAAVAYGRK
ncbi:hypothetical protein ABZ726_02835, partial [Streptomyces hundungensis]|uniref:hypothetical protein n=1 Tax=Streptomyces hundungensis TaxID=1077946 RepID=UPI0033E4010A